MLRPGIERYGNRNGPSHGRHVGFTLIELVVVLVIIGILASIAIESYSNALYRGQVAKAIGDISALQTDIEQYNATHNQLPPDLAAIGRATLADPWGHPYQYLPLTSKNKGQARKDRFLVPLNTDFDLYSMGRDGQSQPPLTASVSRDDIVRANDGSFIGLATDY